MLGLRGVRGMQYMYMYVLSSTLSQTSWLATSEMQGRLYQEREVLTVCIQDVWQETHLHRVHLEVLEPLGKE